MVFPDVLLLRRCAVSLPLREVSLVGQVLKRDYVKMNVGAARHFLSMIILLQAVPRDALLFLLQNVVRQLLLAERASKRRGSSVRRIVAKRLRMKPAGREPALIRQSRSVASRRAEQLFVPDRRMPGSCRAGALVTIPIRRM